MNAGRRRGIGIVSKINGSSKSFGGRHRGASRWANGMKVFLSLTTIPSRLSILSDCVNSLGEQTVQADKIILNVSREYNRFEETISDVQLAPF